MKVEFIYVSPTFGETVLSATTWPEVVSELHESGIVNVGEVKVIKRSYRWVSDEPQIINTDYRRII
jgi:hypothetical protein